MLKNDLSRIKFDPGAHKYTLDGFVVPNVTSVVERFLPYNNMPEDLRQSYMARGTLVHALTEYADKGRTIDTDFLEAIADSGLYGYYEAWHQFKRDYKVGIIDIEMRVYHTQYRYAGTLDRTACFNLRGIDRFGLIEIKTGSLIDEYALQTAAYLEAYNEGRVELDRLGVRLIVCLKEDGSYRTDIHDDKLDWPAFVGALAMYNWRLSHGKR